MRKLIYIVDDSSDVRLFLHRMITRMGHAVRALEDGIELERLLLTERPDLIVIDVMLPHASGYDVLRRLETLGRLRDTPVIVTSGLPRGGLRPPERFRDAPFLSKPLLPGDVRREIERALTPALSQA